MIGTWRGWFACAPNTARRGGAGLVLTAVFFSGLATTADAQGTNGKFRRVSVTREEQKQFVDDLSSARMMDSERDRPSQRRTLSQDLESPTPEMKKLRPLLDKFMNESAQLQSVLSDDFGQGQNDSLRNLLNDAYMVTAQSTNLSKIAREENDHHALANDLQELDATWGALEYRLGAQRRLSKEAQGHIRAMHDIEQSVRDVLDIRQQVDYRNLSARAVALATYLEVLTEDIPVDLGKTTVESRTMVADANRVHQQALTIADLSDEKADMQSIIDEYKKFQQLWYPQAASLQSKNRESLERSLRRIAQTDGEIGQLLLMSQRFDKKQVVYLTSVLRKNLDDFFYYTSLKDLTKMQKASQSLVTADEFYGVCQNFSDIVAHQDDYDHIVDAFRDVEQADSNFLKAFGAIENEDAAASLVKISQTLDALRSSLQVNREDFNRQSANKLAAKIENLTDSIDTAARAWLAHDRQTFSHECLNQTDAMAQAAADLHNKIVSGESVQSIRDSTENLYQQWRKVYNYLVKCQTEDRQTLGRSASQLTPALVELRTLVAQ
ncbi:MAG: hypothetical protein U0872_07810 [Planctomycetaceae bacterium]